MLSGRAQCVLGAALLATAALYTWYNLLSVRDAATTILPVTPFDDTVKTSRNTSDGLIYILEWTDPNMPPFDALKKETEAFKNCPFKNCFVTSKKNYFKKLTDFPVIIFNEKNAVALKRNQFPQVRSPEQIYIFGATESSHYYPLCPEYFEGMFNWTYTYKIDSDIRWGYVTVYDLNGTIVGPKVDMKWLESMDPIDDELKSKLKTKSKAAAWFVSNCYSKSKRERYVRELNQHLKKYKIQVDIYGPCGPLKCPKSRKDECFSKLEKDYYFYLSFENSFAEDYVTEKLLNALNHDAVPIVYGGANYSRFLPPGSYLNAREMPAEKLAAAMDRIMRNTTEYHDFFRWRNHFTYNETTDSYDVCKLCEALNDSNRTSTSTVFSNIRSWFNGALYQHNCKL